ncbi:endonuclease/exonuclease/phosphatase family protein [Rhizobium sp. SSA_523]|uniref:endonuclease/exonuclease/phosphatase family protein n=1 Tax=Rhizobium sp. SSA_523 TaxID=2952477 RepID=UPI0020918713|nr:endonuclease/exonuclease/phosphatase family protein [Rhizobium sp. SSA_523]MCO5730229.1 endonuclease [Rhizobium sp. SSA_523]WKC25287.1 endonuclease [Rhizobium sp. SSA_523]
MPLRLATFNIENLMARFDFSGFRKQWRQDRVVRMFGVEDQELYKDLEQARLISETDDTRQLSALAIAETGADILCLQEVDDMSALNAFEENYLYRMLGKGYKRKVLVEGNDSRGIDVAVMMREETRDGAAIELVDVRSHALMTYQDLDLYSAEIAATNQPQDRIFRRDCLELELRIGGVPLTLYTVHFKSMTTSREDKDGRLATMPVRTAEARAVRHIIEQRFGRHLAEANFAICGDMNDYQERVKVIGDRIDGYRFEPVEEAVSALDIFSHDGFAENIVRRRPLMDRWTLYHARGPEEQHLCQLDYIWLSPRLARRNPDAVPAIIRKGQPYRTVFPPDQAVERFPRTGWDRPKASDHCPVVVSLEIA